MTSIDPLGYFPHHGVVDEESEDEFTVRVEEGADLGALRTLNDEAKRNAEREEFYTDYRCKEQQLKRELIEDERSEAYEKSGGPIADIEDNPSSRFEKALLDITENDDLQWKYAQARKQNGGNEVSKAETKKEMEAIFEGIKLMKVLIPLKTELETLNGRIRYCVDEHALADIGAKRAYTAYENANEKVFMCEQKEKAYKEEEAKRKKIV
jgi:hypothetical protein